MRQRALTAVGAAIVALGCSDGARPASYRAPLESAESGSGPCAAPSDCFDECYCAGHAAADCLAGCDASGADPTGSGGTSTTPSTSSDAPPSSSNPEPTMASGEPADGTPPADDPGGAVMACVPALPSASGAEYLCDPTGALACQNCNDCASIIDGSAKAAATDCGVQCGGSRDCAASCLASSTSLSDGCSDCLLDFFDCLVGNCLGDCLGLTPEACTSCASSKPSASNSCSSQLEACSGARKNPELGG